MKAYYGSGGMAPLILWSRHYVEVSGRFHAPAALPPRKEPLGEGSHSQRSLNLNKLKGLKYLGYDMARKYWKDVSENILN
jgi:hypothetical protein